MSTAPGCLGRIEPGVLRVRSCRDGDHAEDSGRDGDGDAKIQLLTAQLEFVGNPRWISSRYKCWSMRATLREAAASSLRSSALFDVDEIAPDR